MACWSIQACLRPLAAQYSRSLVSNAGSRLVENAFLQSPGFFLCVPGLPTFFPGPAIRLPPQVLFFSVIFYLSFSIIIYSQDLENSWFLNRLASPVICFNLRISSTPIPIFLAIQVSDLPISTSSATILLIRSTL